MTQTLSLYSLPPTGSAGFENFTTLLDATKGWFYHFFLGNQLTKMTFWGFKISPCFCQDASKEWFYHIFPGKPVDKDDLLGFTLMLLSQKNAVNESVAIIKLFGKKLIFLQVKQLCRTHRVWGVCAPISNVNVT